MSQPQPPPSGPQPPMYYAPPPQNQPVAYQGQPVYAQPVAYGQPYQPTPLETTTVTIATIPTQLVWGECSQQATCPHCKQAIITATRHEPGTLTWLAAGGICLLGCWLGCCLIPFAVDSMQDVVHSCPNCHHEIGIKRRM